ncbi:hypothetical protein BC941DRAFT_475709 [Chlamydoabsidia padenii]|nr:hypothetical protein BC941DRAFT_475709 [Chlamydoabsidia padenii]
MPNPLVVNSQLNQHHGVPPFATHTIHKQGNQQAKVTLLHEIEQTDGALGFLTEQDDGSTVTSSPSIPEHIDFNLVYTLHTFEATVEGQASVAKGDALVLLDDTNSYWWLVKVLKSNKTTFERLARLNKNKNVKITTSLLDNSMTIPNTLKKHRNVTMAKDILYQSHIILLGDGNEEVEDVYEEWQDTMVDQTLDPYLSVVDLTRDSIGSGGPTMTGNDDIPIASITGHLPTWNDTTIAIHHTTPLTNSKAIKKPASLLRIFSRAKRYDKKQHGSVVTLPQSGPFSIIPPDKPHSSMTRDASTIVLRVYAGNINVNATYHSVLVNDDTNADDLLGQALDRFHITQIEGKTCGDRQVYRTTTGHQQSMGVEYYLSINSVNDDEWILLPQDKPLLMYRSLTTHLTTPMPFNRSRMEYNPADTEKNNSVRFYLHKRIKRTDERDGNLYVKVSLYHQDTDTTFLKHANSATRFSVLRKKSMLPNTISHSQIDKLIAVPSLATVADLTDIALDKFHLLHQPGHGYCLTLNVNHQERQIYPHSKLIDIISNNSKHQQFVLRSLHQTQFTHPSPLLTPVPIMQLDTSTEIILRRLERAHRNNNETPKRLHLNPHQPKLSVMRNVNQGVDIYLPHGMLRSKPLGPYHTHCILMTRREEGWNIVTQRTLGTFTTTSHVSEGVADSDLKALVEFGTKALESTTGAGFSLDVSSNFDELESELHRIMAIHTIT